MRGFGAKLKVLPGCWAHSNDSQHTVKNGGKVTEIIDMSEKLYDTMDSVKLAHEEDQFEPQK